MLLTPGCPSLVAGTADGVSSYCAATLEGPYCSLCDEAYRVAQLANGWHIYRDAEAVACLPCASLLDGT